MERHVTSYSIHLNVCILETRLTRLADPTLPFSCRKSQTIFRTSSLKIGGCKSKPRISVRSWLRSKICWYASPVTTSTLAELTTRTDQETVDVDRESLVALAQESLEKSKSIQKLEEAAADLYKALQAGRDRGLQNFRCGLTCDGDIPDNLIPDMAAGMERLSEYRTHNSQFCKRIFDYLSIMFTAQVLWPTLYIKGRS